MRFFHEPNIDFVGKRTIFFYFSLISIVVGMVLAMIIGVEYGIDFEGGTEIAVEFDKPVQADEIRNVVTAAGFTGSEIKAFGKENQYLIRIKESADAPARITDALKTEIPGFIAILKVDKIGPKIGSELRFQAFLAVFIAIIAILLYIAFRFEFVFGMGAVIALIHDVLLTFVIIVIVNKLGLNLELNQAVLAGMLTVVGFSINDTVIVFDRIRENRERYKGKSFVAMVNTSINETLSRTVNTTLTVVVVLGTILIFGGPVLEGFAFTMLVGVITGTYSSIFIASSFVIWYLGKVKKVDVEGTGDKKKGAAAPANA